jgi:pimeloyl-ACP methyl ester carboxylesterase
MTRSLIQKIQSGLNLIFFASAFISCASIHTSKQKPTLCILGGTPSTAQILTLIPDSIKSGYNFISFNRAGFGGSANSQMSEEMLYKLATEAGLKKNDFGIIGISGGAPLAILIAEKFHLKHCGIISGMVSKEAFFRYGDKAVTKGVMETALGDYAHFETTAMQFPNLDEIVKQAGASSKEVALRACYDELRFILTENLFPTNKVNTLKIDWWHGEDDVNVPIESAELFLKNYPNANLHRIAKANHGIDANVYISKLLKQWK